MQCCPWAVILARQPSSQQQFQCIKGAMVGKAGKTANGVDPHIATTDHCHFCFSVLHAHLTGAPSPEPVFPNGHCALFVTWNVPSGGRGHWKLRGCIGTLEPRQLHSALHDYTLTSALRDHRFSPIKLKELPSLQCKVSLLARFEPAAGWRDWEVGVHGIIINFLDPVVRCKRSATFLPDVAPEQGWDHQECIDALVRKAGYAGPVTDQLRDSIALERYQSTIASATYEEYQECFAVSGEAGVAPPLVEALA